MPKSRKCGKCWDDEDCSCSKKKCCDAITEALGSVAIRNSENFNVELFNQLYPSDIARASMFATYLTQANFFLSTALS